MFYQCAKYKFALPDLKVPVGGGILAASALPRMRLLRRQKRLVRDYPWLAHRMFDPQLYLFDIPATSKAVPNLATWPWFGVPNPSFDSAQHRKVNEWMEEHESELRQAWGSKEVPPSEIPPAVHSCIDMQVRLGVEALIAPTPLTNLPSGRFERELAFIDAAIDYCRRSNISLPLFATIAITDQVLRGIPPTNNPLLRTITDQVSARDGIAGAYIVLEQSAEHGHYYACEEGCLAALLLCDELSRGAGKKVVVNYLGAFGLVCLAAGATIWASGHYRSQRRLRLADQEEERGSAFPRFFSLRTIGDIGVENNVEKIFRSNARELVLTRTHASEILLRALGSGRSVADVPEWAYTQGNVDAGAAHYYEACIRADGFLLARDRADRVKVVQQWLGRAKKWAEDFGPLQLERGSHTDLTHQAVWLNAFEKWRNHSGL